MKKLLILMALAMGSTLEIQTSKPTQKTKKPKDQAAKAHQDQFELELGHLCATTKMSLDDLYCLPEQDVLRKYASSSDSDQQTNVTRILELRNTPEGRQSRNDVLREMTGRDLSPLDSDQVIQGTLKRAFLLAKLRSNRRQ